MDSAAGAAGYVRVGVGDLESLLALAGITTSCLPLGKQDTRVRSGETPTKSNSMAMYTDR